MSSCSTSGLSCEYGDDIFLNCDTLATCTSGMWHVTPPTNTQCGGSTGVLQSGCPANSGMVPVGQACSPQMTCGYGDTICYCYIDHTGAPQLWGCFPVMSGCPYPRPRVGSACNQPGLQCDYSSCGDSISCTNGLWIVGTGGCHP
jgi:hypothetical protein